MRPGLADPILDSQRIFRSVLEVISRPGRMADVTATIHAPVPLHPAAAGVLLALADCDTPIWLDASARRPVVIDWLRFHCGTRLVDEPAAARLALIADPLRMPPPAVFDAGTAEHPERSATLILQVLALIGGTGRRLTGPGIEHETRLEVVGVPELFWAWVADNHELFPLGVDLLVCAGQMIAALPRTTRVEG